MSNNTYTSAIRTLGPVEAIPYTKDGEQKTFEKRTLVLEQDDQYNDTIVFELGGKTLDIANGYKAGDVVTVHYNISCRENKNKAGQFFTSLKAWRVEGAAPAQSARNEAPQPTDDIPF